MAAYASTLRFKLEEQVRVRTGRHIRDLRIELLPERIVLRGRTSTYYLKQLAQQSVRDLLPQTRLENAIVVESN